MVKSKLIPTMLSKLKNTLDFINSTITCSERVRDITYFYLKRSVCPNSPKDVLDLSFKSEFGDKIVLTCTEMMNMLE